MYNNKLHFIIYGIRSKAISFFLSSFLVSILFFRIFLSKAIWGNRRSTIHSIETRLCPCAVRWQHLYTKWKDYWWPRTSFMEMLNVLPAKVSSTVDHATHWWKGISTTIVTFTQSRSTISLICSFVNAEYYNLKCWTEPRHVFMSSS